MNISLSTHSLIHSFSCIDIVEASNVRHCFWHGLRTPRLRRKEFAVLSYFTASLSSSWFCWSSDMEIKLFQNFKNYNYSHNFTLILTVKVSVSKIHFAADQHHLYQFRAFSQILALHAHLRYLWIESKSLFISRNMTLLYQWSPTLMDLFPELQSKFSCYYLIASTTYILSHRESLWSTSNLIWKCAWKYQNHSVNLSL